MSDRKFTLIELHLDGDTQFGPASLRDVVGDEPTETDEDRAEVDEGRTEIDAGTAVEEEEEGGRSVIGALVALVVLVGIAVAVKKFRGGDETEEFEEREQPDVVVN